MIHPLLTVADKTLSSRSGIFQDAFERHRLALAGAEAACAESMAILCDIAAQTLSAGRRIYLFGNGGSAGDAQHIAAELSVRFIRDRRALPGMALTTDSSVLTACGNDLGFEQIFARQIEAFGAEGDLALGISTSGNSPNVLLGLECAARKGMIAAAFAGKDGGQLRDVAFPLIVVPSDETARVQEMHILLGHILCEEIECRLGVG
jgi:D-sedoheptulose 7-phosphate isomerase